ncbi:MAG: hypothetical protein R3E96_06605 [Planctomycetota bacterium]
MFDGATGTSTLMRLVDRVYAVSETHYVARWVDHNVPNSWGLLAGRLDQFPVAIPLPPEFENFLTVGGRLVGDTWYSVAQESIGGDLNGDGDTEDSVLMGIQLDTGVLWNSGFALNHNHGPFTDDFMLAPVHWGDQLAFAASEISGGQDLNGDGDQTDLVAHVLDGNTHAVTNLGVALYTSSLISQAGPGCLGAVEGVFAFMASETRQAADLDGNGVLDPATVYLYDLQSGASWFPGWHPEYLAPNPDPAMARDVQASADWVAYAGWGETQIQYLNRATGQTGMARIQSEALSDAFTLDGDLLIGPTSEAMDGVDWNQDGDTSDYLLAIEDLSDQHIERHSLGSSFWVPCRSRNGVLLAVPQELTQDLNGDGDMADTVLHSILRKP